MSLIMSRRQLLGTGALAVATVTGLPSLASPAAAAGGGDLVFVKTTATGSGRIEVHRLSASSNYTQFTTHSTTPLATGEATNGTLHLDGVPAAASTAPGSATSGRLNAAIVAAAQAWSTGSHGGQCAAWVQGVIRAAGGTPVFLQNYPWGYQSSWDIICTEVVGWENVQPGDICQWVYPDVVGAHTAIITSGGSEATAQVIDSNYGYTERVNRGSFSSRCNGKYTYKIWRID